MSEHSTIRGLHLHLDCASGAAGDMTLGALIDLGVPREVIDRVLVQLGLGAERLRVARVVKQGIRAIDVKVDDTMDPRLYATREHAHDHEHAHGTREHEHEHAHGSREHEHEHEHAHGSREHEHAHGSREHEHEHEHEHGHTHYRDIKALILDAGLDAAVVERAMDMFERVARAEALLHGVSVDEVAFHEVGAIDSIVDIVGTAAALSWLAPSSVTAASVAVGHGAVKCAHGLLPVPAPATLEILREAGGVAHGGGLARELCTPTGAAILASAVTEWAPMPAMVPVAVGYGAGDKDFPDRPNVMRATVGRLQRAGSERVWRIEANIDDMSPELCEHAAASGFAAGALDVWWTPVVMKKGRPALELSALADEARRDAVVAALVRETTTIGVRMYPVSRQVLGRRVVEVDTAYGRLPVKLALLPAAEGDRVVNAAPEYEPCRRAAEHHEVPLKQVYAAVIAAYERSGAPSGERPDERAGERLDERSGLHR